MVLAVLVVSHLEVGADIPLHGVASPGTGSEADMPPPSIEGLTLWTKGPQEERRKMALELAKELRRHFRNPDGKSSFPIVVTVTDGRGQPVRGAIVVLKRLGPDGWTEEELKRDAKARTDEQGTITLHYPGKAREDGEGGLVMDVVGAATVIAEGHEARMVELKDFFKDGKHVLSKETAPVLTIVVGE